MRHPFSTLDIQVRPTYLTHPIHHIGFIYSITSSFNIQYNATASNMAMALPHLFPQNAHPHHQSSHPHVSHNRLDVYEEDDEFDASSIRITSLAEFAVNHSMLPAADMQSTSICINECRNICIRTICPAPSGGTKCMMSPITPRVK